MALFKLNSTGPPGPTIKAAHLALRLVLTAVAIYYSIQPGFLFTSLEDNPFLIAPVAGISISAILLIGWPAVIAVLAGSLLAYSSYDMPLPVMAIAVGGIALQPVFAAWLLRKLKFDRAMDRLQDVMILIIGGGLFCTLIINTAGATALASLGVISWLKLPGILLVSWLADAFGVIVFSPLLLRWVGTPLRPVGGIRLVEAALASLLLVAVNLMVFGEYGIPHEYGFSLAFLNVPLLLWAALRLGMHGATLASAMTSIVAVVTTSLHIGPFASEAPEVDLAMVWVYVMIVSVSTLILGAIVTENRRAWSALHNGILAASRTQINLLPDGSQLGQIERETGLRISYRYSASESMGGDVLGVQLTGPDEVCLFLADVAGHGIEASLSAVSLHTFIQATLARTTSAANLARAVNQFCHQKLPHDSFATLVYLRCQPSRNRVEAVIAGHPPLIVWNRQGHLRRIHAQYPAMGMFADAADTAEPLVFHLSNNDRLLVYSDGVTEARNENNEMYASEKLHELLRSMADTDIADIPVYVLGEVNEWCSGRTEPRDDITVVAIGLDRAQLALGGLEPREENEAVYDV